MEHRLNDTESRSQRTRIKTSTSATSCTTKPKLIVLGPYADLRGEKPASKRLSYGTAFWMYRRAINESPTQATFNLPEASCFQGNQQLLCLSLPVSMIYILESGRDSLSLLVLFHVYNRGWKQRQKPLL
jgi:hypothetical protein